ncbi:MAG: type II secretion system protein GspC [Candidatus Binatales bacterium]
MGFNLSERYVTALNVLLIAGIAYLAALSVNDIIAGRLSGAIRVAPPGAPVALAPVETYARDHYNEIVTRNIFSLPQVQAPPAEPPPIDLHLKLLGTSLQTKEKPWAIIMDERNNEQALYRLDDDIPDAGKLVTIEKSRVFVEVQGKRIALEIPANPTPDSPDSDLPVRPGVGITRRGNPQPLPPRIRRRRGNHFVVPRSDVESSLSNMMPLLTQMRALPDPEDKGFKLSEIQPDSIFQEMGLRDGDVVSAINGQPLTDPTQAIELLNSLRDQNSVGISIVRAGHPQQFTYEIR